MTIKEYVAKVDTLYRTGNAREHSYRGDLQNLLMAMLPDVLVTNEPARVACGAPDYVLTKKDIPVGYIEAKDIGVDLAHKSLKEQFDRYKSGLSNLIITDYLQFQFFKDGEPLEQIEIAKVEGGGIVAIPQNFERFTLLIKNFAETVSQSIKSPSKLAEMMAGKARLMADVIEKSLDKDDESEQKSNLKSQMLSFKSMLIHDIDNKAFSDIYAQTIAYGMFAARYHDPSLADFSRTEAAQLIPKSNPFLRKLFQDIAGFDLDDRLVWIVDELVSIFLASDVATIMKGFGKSTKQEDAVVHFYETFLGEYNPALRKARGVWYTPEPVVNFIVRAVDDVLKSEFGLTQGLADNSKTTVKVDTQIPDKRSSTGYKQTIKEVHKVQILDPATGTGTFLAEVVKHIYKRFKGQQGIWSQYVSKDLIPRLNGFELLMASYAMAHLKMDMLLTETGYDSNTDQRFRIFLTNSLEEAHPDTGTLFSSWLSDESNQANALKRDTPVMVVIGNPPYSVSSSNKSEWIENLTADYKNGLNERNIQPLSDDYIKFIRFGQHYIDKNSNGVLAFISNNSFIDGVIHRQMRKHLLETFDKIYILDLHGNAKKKEVSPDGSPDQNVFDIMQGVSINIFIKHPETKKGGLGRVYHADVYGKREYKYNELNTNSLKSISFTELPNEAPNYFFVAKDFANKESYESGFYVPDLFPFKTSGVKTHDDKNMVATSKSELESKVVGLNHDYDKSKVFPYTYRPFDNGFIYYDTEILGRARQRTIYHLKHPNVGLVLVAQPQAANLSHFDCSFVTTELTDTNMFRRGGPVTFPLYLYNSDENQRDTDGRNRIPNINVELAQKLAVVIGGNYETETNDNPESVTPENILDYVYAVLHSPDFRKTYHEFLMFDFPRIPYPESANNFQILVEYGRKLRNVHLLVDDCLDEYVTQYPVSGDNIITRKMTKSSIGYESTNSDSGKVWINDQQYFDNVPLVAWEFYVGGYQPAQKWLKDRQGRELSFEDILHYQKIIVALVETDRIMKEIDEVGVF